MRYVDEEYYIALCERDFEKDIPDDVDLDECEKPSDHGCPYCSYQCNYCLGTSY